VSSHTILIVEDDDTIRESLVDFLGENGYDAQGAVDGQDALTQLQRPGQLPCLIVLDMMMPVMDGEAFREKQLRDPKLATIPTVVMSAHYAGRSMAEAVDATAFMKKPLDLDEFLQFVHEYC
jgi:CheY-like chemotaxis protein